MLEVSGHLSQKLDKNRREWLNNYKALLKRVVLHERDMSEKTEYMKELIESIRGVESKLREEFYEKLDDEKDGIYRDLNTSARQILDLVDQEMKEYDTSLEDIRREYRTLTTELDDRGKETIESVYSLLETRLEEKEQALNNIRDQYKSLIDKLNSAFIVKESNILGDDAGKNEKNQRMWYLAIAPTKAKDTDGFGEALNRELIKFSFHVL